MSHTPSSTASGYVIASDSQRNDETLFMVDRRKQRASFWSNRLDDVLVFADRGAADRKAASLRFNRPRVMTLYAARSDAADARRAVHERDEEHTWNQAMSDRESAWDGHKGYFS